MSLIHLPQKRTEQYSFLGQIAFLSLKSGREWYLALNPFLKNLLPDTTGWWEGGGSIVVASLQVGHKFGLFCDSVTQWSPDRG
jgi:hypothetical protein